jgi:hypothetical protein
MAVDERAFGRLPAGDRPRRFPSAYGGYHGTTGGTMATTAKGGMWACCYPVLPHDTGHAKIPYSYPYRCPVGASPANCAEACLEFTRRMLLGKEPPFTEHRGHVSNVARCCWNPCRRALATSFPATATCAASASSADAHSSASLAQRRPTGAPPG